MRTLHKNYIGYAVFACVLLFNTVNIISERPKNWDMLAYVWIALEQGDLTEAELHTETYEAVKRQASPEAYQKLIEEPTYRKKVAEDHDLFAEQIGFYTVKLVYPMLMRAATFAGVDPVTAARGISALSYFAIGAFVFLILRSFCPALISSAASAIIVSLPFFTQLGLLITPDALSAACLLFAAYVFHVRKSKLWPMLILIAAGLIRPDNFIAAGCILTAAFITQSVNRYQYLAFAALMGAVYFGLQYVADYHGWALHFYVTFVERIPAIEDFVSPLTFSDYAAIYPVILGATAAYSWFLIFATAGLLILATRFENARLKNVFQRALFALITLILVLKIIPPEYINNAFADFGGLATTLWLALLLIVSAMAVAIVSLALFLPSWAGYPRKDLNAAILPGVLTYYFIHFALFPAAKDRMIAASYIYVLILLVSELARIGFFETLRKEIKAAIQGAGKHAAPAKVK